MPTNFIVLTAVAFTPHCCPVVDRRGPPRASVQLSNALDAANRCTRLPATPSAVTLQLGGMAPLTDGTVHLRLASGGDDDEQLLVVAASSASVAISRACRELVREHGLQVAAIDVGVREEQGTATPLRRARLATQRWRLLAAYGVWAQLHAANEHEPAATQPHQCKVLFVERGVAEHTSAAAAASLHAVGATPVVGGVVRAGSALLGRLGRAQLTPTYPPSLALRLLRYLPWRLQRLAARAWVQSMLAEHPTRAVAGEATPYRHPMESVRVLPLLSPAACADAVTEAEEYAAREGGWSTDRHVAYPTTDIPIRCLPRLEALWRERLFPAVEAEARTRLGLGPATRVLPLDVFVVKYAAGVAGGQTELAVHRDNGVLTFSLLLNAPSEFEGGGTYFERAGRVYRPSLGVGVLHSALVRHAGYPITRGVRYVLVGFCGLESPALAPGFARWRFGQDPPWFVSSRVVSDAQILRRVWPAAGLAGGDWGAGVGGAGVGGTGVAVANGAAETMEAMEMMEAEAEMEADAEEEVVEEEVVAVTKEVEAGLGIEANAAAGLETDADAAVDEKPDAEKPDTEKPWYRVQHERAALARTRGRLLARHTGAHGTLSFELWRDGDDMAALLVAPEGSLVVASMLLRAGPLDNPTLRLFKRLLPPPRRRHVWLGRVRRPLLRPNLLGVVHVYVAPEWRGAERGSALLEHALRALRGRGVTHVLTLADDRGSGKLREWYERHGFVDTAQFTETAMVARLL